jgi:hypothetical protein
MSSKWEEGIAEFDKDVKREEYRNKKVIEIIIKDKGRTDGTDEIYSVNSLSGDRILEQELKLWRVALKGLRRL